jgi:hypothetical protein
VASAQAANLQLYCGLAGLCLLVGVSACKSEQDPAVVADRFVDAYYLEFDIAKARTFAAGAAIERLQQEEDLAKAAREKMQIAASKARVYYEAPERRPIGDDMFHATYPLEIREGTSLIARKAIIMVAKRDGAWRVIQFREQHEGPALPDESATATTAAARGAP